MRSSRILLTIGMVAFTPFQVNAVTESIPFDLQIDNACIITIGESGKMVPDADLLFLRSWLPGGAGAFADLSVTGGIYNVTVQKPLQFDVAPASAANAEFSSTYTLMGATEAVNVDSGISSTLNPGVTTLRVHASAWLPNSAIFEPGEYRTTATVTCQ